MSAQHRNAIKTMAAQIEPGLLALGLSRDTIAIGVPSWTRVVDGFLRNSIILNCPTWDFNQWFFDAGVEVLPPATAVVALKPGKLKNFHWGATFSIEPSGLHVNWGLVPKSPWDSTSLLGSEPMRRISEFLDATSSLEKAAQLIDSMVLSAGEHKKHALHAYTAIRLRQGRFEEALSAYRDYLARHALPVRAKDEWLLALEDAVKTGHCEFLPLK